MLPLFLLSAVLTASANAQIFTLKTYAPGSPLDNQVIQASGQAFYLGLAAPTTYCPEIVEPFCPDTDETIIAGVMGGMYVNVPGGQQIFVRVDGSIGYTQAHSASVSAGAYRGGFVNVTITSECGPTVNVFAWKTPGGTSEGVLACPDIPEYMVNTPATHQIRVRTPELDVTDCVELEGLLPVILTEPIQFGAWQYT
ncbi:uncharacterized protein RSE6_03396 [Rhynchosporium secalis]|uniref:Uncharacterized protein n=1 Tax=Rhynchosporium secalis TaxID=38038 RepID=A0A1E1M2N8_RHYSE|nr:uncharacterized protein RSE6_03396 [Rhynchosporium secalis]